MPLELPPPPGITVSIHGAQATGAGAGPQVPLEAAQPPLQIPQSDLVVEVVGQLPMRIKLEDMSRLLVRRQQTQSFNRRYLPIILELIMLVERNPQKPRGRAWNSIGALTLLYDVPTTQVTVEYCIDYCTHDPKTGAFHPKRKMVSYRALERVVDTRLNKKLRELQKFAER
jgi:hypothetical protein